MRRISLSSRLPRQRFLPAGWILFCVLQVAAVLAAAIPARAQLSVSVTPIRAEHELVGGQIKTDVITVENLADRVFRARIVVSDWFLERDGTPVFVKQSPARQFSMNGWIDVNPTEFSLRPGETRSIRYTLTVPADAPDGGYRGAILIESIPDPQVQTSAQTANITARIGVIIYNRVGTPTPNVEVTRQRLVPNPDAPGEMALALTLRNTSVVHFRYRGSSEIVDAGGAVLATLDLADTVVLPLSERDVVVPLGRAIPPTAVVVTRLDLGRPERLRIESRVTPAEEEP